MFLGIAIVLVVVLLAIALLPARRREVEVKQSIVPTLLTAPEPIRSTTLRKQQLVEEASAIAQEYERRADEVWLEELKTKASLLLSPK